ncbi:hypothetical protein ASD42_22610 [Nocardia sp. Root136]|uniref:hypothetical protein n=1 Tax=Nocardia sp. Root136 TaxID=1736458 RepID=UPI0006F66931|nr:hypothetical protein [Nocardia sp. Root136]KQY31424.1 hypothetical protein ASD42_22610 [Nocardia sp. Root136]
MTWTESLVVGGIAVVSSAATLTIQSLFQSSLAATERQHRLVMVNDERLWLRRADLYVEMLGQQGGGMAEGYRGARTEKEWAAQRELVPRVLAFSSSSVRTAWNASAEASRELGDYVDNFWPQWHAAEPEDREAIEIEMHHDTHLRQLESASAESAKNLENLIRSELKTAHEDAAGQ